MSYYIKDSIVPVDEEDQYEFKAHRNFSSDEVPAWRPDGTKICPSRAMAEYYKLKNANRTRQPISRNICGFLNRGKGGTIMIGVLDSGKVVGISLSSLQKDHLLLSLEDAMRRFKPRVPHEFIKVAFIPVMDDESEVHYLNQPRMCEPPQDIKRQPHQLRTSSLCWCDHHAMNRFKLGYVSMYYVVEVRVAPLHPELRTPEVTKALSKLMREELSPLARLSWPAFTSEDLNLFLRTLNSLVKYTVEEITNMNNYQTEMYVRHELAHMENMSVYDAERHKHLQSLMPDGVVVSKAYMQSILDHTATEMFTLSKPMTENDEEEAGTSAEISKPNGQASAEISKPNEQASAEISKTNEQACQANGERLEDTSDSSSSETESDTSETLSSSSTSSDVEDSKTDEDVENLSTKFVDDLLLL